LLNVQYIFIQLLSKRSIQLQTNFTANQLFAMRKILQYLLKRPLTWMGNKLSSSPQRAEVFKSLSKLYHRINKPNSSKLKTIEVDLSKDNFIIFSDQHKGDNGWADDFRNCEPNYIAALRHYDEQCFNFINLGDSEELWKFTAQEILPANVIPFAAEAAFQPDRYYKTFGNHDIIWKNKLDVVFWLHKYFTMPLPVYEGIILKIKNLSIPLHIFLTHGHQGDKMSDNNSLSTWIVAHLWMPLQRYLRININTPSKDFSLKNKHNQMMYEWSSRRKNLLLITGHTHSPVFASGKYLDHPSNEIDTGQSKHEVKPTYFNSGCCCFNDGDITGIEIADNFIRLIKWHSENNISSRTVLEEIEIGKLIGDL
jgi:predicted phosphodiesterase